MVEDQDNCHTRRSVLRTIPGIAVTGALGAGPAAGQPGRSGSQFRRLMRQAHKIEDRAGIKQRLKFLKAHDIPTSHDRLVFKRPEEPPAPDGVGVQSDDGTGQLNFCVEPDKCDGDIDLSLILSADPYGGHYYVSLSMRYRYSLDITTFGTTYLGPQDPVDGAAIMWEKDHWQVEDPNDIPASTDTGDEVQWDNGSWNQQSVAFRVDSRDNSFNSGETGGAQDWSDYTHAGVYLVTGDAYETGDPIHAKYSYTWSGGSVNSVSASYPWGISVSASWSTKQEDLQTDLNGESLRVTTSDSW